MYAPEKRVAFDRWAAHIISVISGSSRVCRNARDALEMTKWLNDQIDRIETKIDREVRKALTELGHQRFIT
jgi:hypothetical protein